MELADIKPGEVITEEMVRFIECLPEDAKRELLDRIVKEESVKENEESCDQWGKPSEKYLVVVTWRLASWLQALFFSPKTFIGMEVPGLRAIDLDNKYWIGLGYRRVRQSSVQ